MICDGNGGRCPHTPMRAPRLVVPSRLALVAPDHAPIRVMTTEHYCELHRGEPKIGDYLTDAVKARIEAVARRTRPVGFQCDFDKATLELVLVTTPEYRAWLQKLDWQRWARERAA